MANLFFPQLTSGAIAQYPIQKSKLVRTVKNVLNDGNMILYADPCGTRLFWELRYTELSAADTQSLQSHFDLCAGPFRAFTFIDPTENMLNFSVDLTTSAWQNATGLKIAGGNTDPEGGLTAFTLTNAGQSSEEISQSLAVPANYQFCFSIYVRSAQATTVTLIRRGDAESQSATYNTGPAWTRLVSTGRLNDTGTTFSVAIALDAGQQIQIFGPQLEAQIEPSRYRATNGPGGVYPNAHWAVDQLPVIADAPNSFSTVFGIETVA
jgi:hypothetical protein